MRFKRTKSNCVSCPLDGNNKVYGEGPENPKIFFIGEAPGAEEDVMKKPFVGKAGDFFNWGLHKADILRHRTWVTNVLCCRPLNNKITSEDSLQALECCKPGLIEELNFFKHNLKVICTLGKTAMNTMDISGGITALRGSVFGEHLPTIPTYHPSYLNRMSYNKRDDSVNFKYVWISDLLKVKKISESGWIAPKENFILSPSVNDLAGWIIDAQENQDLIAVDIETFNHDVDVIGLATGSESAISIPFVIKDKGKLFSYWGNETDKVIKMIEALFFTNKLMFQNALFDVRELLEREWKIPFRNIKHDTMLLHHAISPELPHDLGFIVSLYGSTPYWKGDAGEAGTIERWTYNLRDCVVLHQVLPGLLEELHETHTDKIYLKESILLIKPIIKMMMNGFSYDEKALNKWIRKLKKIQAEIILDLFKVGKLPEGFNLSADDDVRYFLYNILPSKLKNLDEKLKSKKRKDTIVYKELEDKIILRDKTEQIYKPKTFGRRTPTGKLKVDKQGRLGLKRQLNNRLFSIQGFKKPTDGHKLELKNIRKLNKWLDIFEDYKTNQKFITTYARFETGEDGKVHTSLLIHGTSTGRLASRDPNLQNPPKKISGIRKAFIASPGCILLAADYSNLEVRVLAYEANDEVLIQALEAGINIHDLNTEQLFGLTKKDPLWKSCRDATKVFFFGGTAYGGSLTEIYDKVLLRAPEANLSFKKFKSLIEQIEHDHPAIVEYKESITKYVKKYRKIENFAGRVRILMGSERDIIKQGLNYKPQSGAASIINQATIRIDNILDDRNLKTKMILQVHDELLFDVVEEELEIMKVIIKTEMEKQVNFRGILRSFPVDITTGKTWGDLE